MTIAIIGSGAMGSLLGGHLSRSGADVILYDIFQAHVDTVNNDGLVIECADGVARTADAQYEGGAPLTVRPRATIDPAACAGADVFVFFVKSTATKAAAEQFSSLAGSDAIAVTMQNGLGNGDVLAEFFGSDRVAAGVTSQGATFLGPGRIRHAGTGPTHLCMASGENAKLEPFVAALQAAGFDADIEPDIGNLIWSKLVINVGINALTALTSMENGRLAAYPGTDELLELLVGEAVAVAEARGVELTYDDPVAVVREVAQKTATNRSSMLQDFDRKRRSEIDVINGAVVEAGRKLGIPTPYNRAVTLLVRTMDQVHGEEAM